MKKKEIFQFSLISTNLMFPTSFVPLYNGVCDKWNCY
jgi:hypothetical protein